MSAKVMKVDLPEQDYCLVGAPVPGTPARMLLAANDNRTPFELARMRMGALVVPNVGVRPCWQLV